MNQQSLNDNYQGVWGNRIGFGKKPVLLLVDFIQSYITASEPLYAPDVITAVQETEAVLALAREQNILVIHTNILYHAKNQIDGGMWVKKSPVMGDFLCIKIRNRLFLIFQRQQPDRHI